MAVLEPVVAPPPSAITEPVGRVLLALLRQAVREHAASERRRVFAPVVHVGVPGAPGAPGAPARLVLGEQRLDHALRTDALEAMLRRVGRLSRLPSPGSPPAEARPCLVWLTRPGSLEPRDVDLAWLAAARTASAETGLALPMVVVNRRSWRDPSTGVAREWVRLR